MFIIMKNYRDLFIEKEPMKRKEGITFGGVHYDTPRYSEIFYSLTKDILDGVYDEDYSPKELHSMFKKTIRLNYDDLPVSVKKKKSYRKLGDIYVLMNNDVKGYVRVIQRIGEVTKKDIEFHTPPMNKTYK